MLETKERIAPDFISLAEVARILQRTPSAAKSVILATGIRVQNLPGARLLYSRSDTERVADRAVAALAS
jgi:hypothetical protein